jgi:hypothetical protein
MRLSLLAAALLPFLLPPDARSEGLPVGPALRGPVNYTGFGGGIGYLAPAFDGDWLLVPAQESSGWLNPTYTTTFLRLRPRRAPIPIAETSSDWEPRLATSVSIGDGLAALYSFGDYWTYGDTVGVFEVPPASDTMLRVAGGDVVWPVPPPADGAGFGPPSSWGGRLAFTAYLMDPPARSYVFLHDEAAGLIEVAGPDTDRFADADYLDLYDPTLGQNAIVFGAAYSSGPADAATSVESIHRRTIGSDGAPGPLETLVASGDPRPQDGAPFASFSNLQIDRARGDAACFVGMRTGVVYEPGVYVVRGNAVSLVADETTPIPEGHGTFAWVNQVICAIDDGVVAFTGAGADGQAGIYRQAPGGPLEKVAAVGDVLDGSEVLDLQLGREALASGRIAFTALLHRGDDVIGRETQSVVFVPEPDAALVGATALLALRIRRRLA